MLQETHRSTGTDPSPLCDEVAEGEVMVENVIWPAYLDARNSRSSGRRVPLDLAVTDPTVEEIAAAVEQVGYNADVDPEARYPKEFEARGRVIVYDVEDTKNDLIQAVAAYLAAMRD